MKGVSKRSAFIIDKEGMVHYAGVLENASENRILQLYKKLYLNAINLLSKRSLREFYKNDSC
jgi:hypothetical protein